MSGLSLLPDDLATIGKYVLARGRWGRTQIIDERWFDVSVKPSVPSVPSAGLLRWLIRDLTLTISHEHLDALIAAGSPVDLVRKLEAAKGTYTSENAFALTLQRVLGQDWRQELGQLPKGVPYFTMQDSGPLGYRAEGWLGQYRYVFPNQDLVAVRMISSDSVRDEADDSFPEFEGLVLDLVHSLG